MKKKLFPAILFCFSALIGLSAQNNLKLTADEAVTMGINESFELYSGRIGLKIAEEQSALAIREWLPMLSLTWTGSDIVNNSNTDTHNNNLSAKISQQLFDGGASIARSRLQNGQLAIEMEKLRLSELSLKNSLWLNYNQLLIQKKQLQLKKESLKQAKNQLNIYTLEASHGSVTNIEFLQAKISVKEFELDIENTRQSYTDAMFNFKQLLGIPQQFDIELIDSGVKEYRGLDIPLDENQIIAMAIGSNLEYKAAILELNQLKEEYNLSRQTYIPKLSLELSAGFAGDDFPLTSPSFSAGINVDFSDPSLPVTASLLGGTTGEDTRNRTTSVSVSPFKQVGYSLTIKQAEIKIQEQQKKIETLKDSIPHIALSAYTNYQLKRKSIEISSEILDLKRRELNILSLKKSQGEIKRSELIDAQINFAKEEAGFLENLLDLIKAEQEFAASIGLTPFELQSLSKTEEDLSK